MPVVSKYCDKCGIKIPIGDFEDGHALEYEQAYYCRNCKGSVVPVPEAPASPAKAPEAAPVAPAPRPLRKAPQARRAGRALGKAHGKAPVAEGKEPGKGKVAAKGEEGGKPRPSGRKGILGRTAKAAPPKGAPTEKAAPTKGAPAGKAGSAKLRGGAGKAAPSARRKGVAPVRGTRAAGRKGSARLAARAAPDSRRRSAPPEEPREGEAAEEAAAKGGGLRLYFFLLGGAGLAIIVGVIVIIIAVMGGENGGETVKENGGGTEETTTTTAETDEGAPPPEETAVLEDLKRLIGDFPDQLDRIREQVDLARAEIKHPSLVKELSEVWEAARLDAERLLRQALEELIQQAQDYVESEEYDLALSVLKDIPEEVRGTESYGRVTGLKQKISRFKEVEEEVRYYETRAAHLAKEGKYDEAQGTLDAINLEDYKGTPIYERVKALKERYRKAEWTEEDQAALAAGEKREFEALKAKVEKYASAERLEYALALEELKRRLSEFEGTEYEQKVRDLIVWVGDAMTKYLLELAKAEGERLIGTNLLYWSVRDGDQSNVWEIDKERKVLKGETPSGSFIGYSSNRWKDYMIEFQLKKILPGTKADLAMRITQASGGPEYAKIPLEGAKKEWKTYRFVVWGDKFYEVDVDGGAVRDVDASTRGQLAEKGAIGFKLTGNSSVQIKGAVYRPIERKRS